MRLLATADLHYNHPRSRASAEALIDRLNGIEADVLLLVGDTAVAEGDDLEQCLSRFRFDGPRLFVPGNHELWTRGPDSYTILSEDLPRRVKKLGWRYLPEEPFVQGDVGIVGSVGWYDYSFAPAHLDIPRRFYEAKISPGAAARFGEFEHLLADSSDIPPAAMEIMARWNDGKFVKLGRSDEAFLEELMEVIEVQLRGVATIKHVVAAVHHVPFAELLPPAHKAQWDFARAYLGSGRMGELLMKFANVKTALCGHSHFAAEATIGGIRAINIGSGYRVKAHVVLDL